MSKKDRYEALEIVVKVREDGQSWFDVISDFITGDCEGGGGECLDDPDSPDPDCSTHEHTEEIPCTCGLETLSGSSGTLNECYKWLMPDWEEEEDGKD